VVGVTECTGEEAVEVQIYSDIAIIIKPGYVRVVKYSSVEVESTGEGSVRVRIANSRGEVSEYCAKRFSVHPFSVPTPLTVAR
jgi:hypothetical protein